MAIYKINNIRSLKRIALKANGESFYRESIVTSKSNVLVSLQLARELYRNNKTCTYNVNYSVIVFIDENGNIFIVPHCRKFEEVLIQEQYSQDNSIFVPRIRADNLEKLMDIIFWKFAMMLGE